MDHDEDTSEWLRFSREEFEELKIYLYEFEVLEEQRLWMNGEGWVYLRFESRIAPMVLLRLVGKR